MLKCTRRRDQKAILDTIEGRRSQMRFNYEGAEGVIHLTVKETEQFLSGKVIERLIKIVSMGGDFTVTLCLKELDKIDA
jgi:hypothetical protein